MPADAGRITALIDGDISGLKSALGQARSEATSAVSGIESSFRTGLGSGIRDSMSGLASSMGPIGGALSAIGPAGIAAGAGIAVIGGALSSSVQAAASFETSMSGVAKTTGLAGPELSALGTSILEMSSTMPVAASELANIVQVAGSLGVAKEELAGFSEAAAQMSVAFEMPAEQAATAAAKILTAFSMDIDTSNMESLGNVVNTMGDSFAATEPEVLDFINRASFLNTTMGQSIPQVAALGTALISAGMSSETASTGIKSFLSMATSVTANKDNLTSWATLLGTSVDELKGKLAGDLNGTLAETAQKIAAIEDPTERFQAAVKLAGTEGAPAILKLAAAGDTLQSALQKANSEWENGSSMMKTFEQNSSTLNAEWDTFTNTITRAGVELGSVLLPTITGIVSAMNDWALAGIEAGEATYDWAVGMGESISDVFASSDKWLNETFGFYEAGEAAGEEMAEAIEESPDLQDAPGEALGSPEALNKIGDAAEAAGETYEQRIKRQIGEWKENFVGEIFGEKGNLDDRIKGQVEIGGGLFTAVDYDINNEYGNYKLNTPTGSIEYSSLDEMKEKAPEDIAAYIGRELTDLEKAQALGDTQLAIQLQANPEVEFQFDFDIDKALSFSPESERGAMYNMLLTTLNNAGTDAATESARTTAEEYGKALQEVDWANLPGLQAAAAKLKAAKGELYSGVGDKSWADLIDNQTEAYKDALMAQITDIAEFTKQQGETLAGSITDAFSDALLTEDERALIVAMEPMLDMLAAEAPEEFEKSGMAAILSFIEAVKSGASSAELDAMWDTIMGKMDSKMEEAKSKLQDGSGMFYGDFLTQAHDYTDFMNGYGYVGPTEYYDDYIAQKQGQISGALAALQNVEDIQVGLKVDTTQGERDISSFKSTTEKENIDKPLKIDRTKASEEIALVDKAITAAMVKPISLSGVETVMGQIAAIDAAAAKPVIKPIYLQMGYGSAGGAGGDSGNTWGDWMPSFANEGYVRSPTLAVIGDRPGGEYVVGAARFEAAASKIRSGGAPQITIHYNPVINGSGLSSDELSRVLEDHDEKLINKIVEAKEWG